MNYVVRLNKRLLAEFSGRVKASESDGCLFLEGELDNWDDIVRAGNLAVRARKKDTRRFVREMQTASESRLGGVVNTIHLTAHERSDGVRQSGQQPMRIPALQDKAIEGQRPDILVIGGGISGCTIARELSRHNLDILLVDKEHDLAMHASSRNDGVVHPGLELRKGTWKYHYNHRGNAMYGRLCEELGVDFDRSGEYGCFTNPLYKPFLYLKLLHWKWLGVPVRVIGKKELRRLEPGLKKDLVLAVYFPSMGVVCPYNLTIACGENAVQNGARISFDTAVLGMETGNGRIIAVRTNRGMVYPKLVINAAGVFADDVAAMAGDRFFSIHPRRGSNAILDKKFTRILARDSVAKVGETKDAHTKGGGVIRTVHHNILVGPDAVETPERENFAVTRESIERTIRKFTATCTELNIGQLITCFTGIRAPVYEEDFIVCKGRRCANLIHAAGIQSPGLTAAPAIAIDVAAWAVEMLKAAGQTVLPNKLFNPVRKRIPHIAAMSDEERAAMIQQNADYGVILCRCEEVSKGEIIDSLRRTVPCDTIDGVKRRVRPGMGRCQGGFCGPLVLQIIAEEKGIPLETISKNGGESKILCGPTKGYA